MSRVGGSAGGRERGGEGGWSWSVLAGRAGGGYDHAGHSCKWIAM